MLRKKRLDNINRCKRIIPKIPSSSQILKTSWLSRGKRKPFKLEGKEIFNKFHYHQVSSKNEILSSQSR